MPSSILIIPDKFKGTLTARAAADAISRGWLKARPKDHVKLLPMSDGGDGFGEVISGLLRANRQTTRTVDAAHRPCRASWWWQPKTKTAIIESARVIGLAMLPAGKFHPFQLDTFGLGALLRRAVKKGARRVIIGIGGSATNDGGFGLARALEWRFLDSESRQIARWTGLRSLKEIHPPSNPVLGRSVEVVVAVDVQNPLLGKHGATRVYGPQKGLRTKDFTVAERCLRQLASVARRQFKRNFAGSPGAGAAGGLGFGLMAFARATPQNGFKLFAELSKLSHQLRSADLVVTGEGMIDRSSLMGKGAGEIVRCCGKMRIPCIGLAGSTDHSPGLKRLFAHVYALTDLTSPAKAKAKPAFWLERLAELVAGTKAAGVSSVRAASQCRHGKIGPRECSFVVESS